MKKIATIFAALIVLLSASLFAEEKVGTVVDVINNDTQFIYQYTDSWSKQIFVDDNGDVHIAYKDAYVDGADTNFVFKYTNVTDGNTYVLPRSGIGVGTVLLDGAGTDVYMYTGKDYWTAWYYDWGSEFGKIFKVTASGVDSVGMDSQNGYYADPMWAWAQDIRVVNNNSIFTFHSLWSAIEWCVASFDGTTQQWGEKYNIGWTYPDQEVPGVRVQQSGIFYRNLTSAGALAVNADATELTVGVISPFINVYLYKGSFGGLIWADSLYLAPGGMAENDASHIDAIYDTTGIATHPTTISDDQPKPWSYLDLEYDANGVLHAVYNATYSSTEYDTATGQAARGIGQGDFNAQFYDGSTHPRLQLLHWDNSTRTVSTVAKAELPVAGETLVWFYPDSNGTPDPMRPISYGEYDKAFGFMNNPQLIINKNPQGDEPLYAVVWSEAQPGTVQMFNMGSIDSTGAFVVSSNYIGYFSDIKFATSSNGASWSTPVNVTNTMEWDEHEVSAHADIIDGKLHLTYTCDAIKGSDTWQCDTEEHYMDYIAKSMPWTKNDSYIMYHAVDVNATSIDDENVANNFRLEQNYPNPFNPTTQISYQIPAPGKVRLEVYNLLGNKIRTLVNENSTRAGVYNIEWNGLTDDGRSAASGIYIYKLTSEVGVKAKKMILQK
ncbi:MAG: T9SS type A sorting domain-containing protein [Candidatus Marinimicrobia bacterium]|nr:T9SS type A sorting domain-containing protein [Candidatus Neomarinimicrobiota bacterium]